MPLPYLFWYDKVSDPGYTGVSNRSFYKPFEKKFDHTQSDTKFDWKTESEVRNANFLLQMG